MNSSARMTAEEKFSATQKKEERVLSDREEDIRTRAEKTERLKALRLGKSKPEPKV